MRQLKKISVCALSTLLAFSFMACPSNAANKREQKIYANNQVICLNDAKQMEVKANGKLKFVVSNPSVLTVSKTGKIEGKKVGTTNVKIIASKTSKYKATSKTITVQVKKHDVVTKKVEDAVCTDATYHNGAEYKDFCRNCGKEISGSASAGPHDFKVIEAENLDSGGTDYVHVCKTCNYSFVEKQ